MSITFESYATSIIIIVKFFYSFFYLDYVWYLLTYYQIKPEDVISFTHNHTINVKFFSIFYFISTSLTFIYFFIFGFAVYLTSENQTSSKVIVKECLWFVSKILREVEKEFMNIDDTLFILLLLFIVFGWFFFLCIMPASIQDNVFSYVILMIPFMCSLIVWIPVFIMYDQGIFFLTYLRGTSSTTIFILELIYDYLCILIIFMRILIQNLRFFFMFLVYFELQEHVEVFSSLQFIPYPDPYLGEAGTRLFVPKTIKWFIIFKLPTIIISSLYYIGHLYAIFISNSIAYVFLVFWLYLFFYSCFYTRKFENFFKNRHNKYKSKNF